MLSLQAKIANKLLPLFFANWAKGTIQEQRARQDKSTKFMMLPKDIQCRPVELNGVPAEWIEAPGAGAGILIYLHGGAYGVGSVGAHRELIARLARASQCRALGVSYRLAPEHPFPAALEDVLSVYRGLVADGHAPSHIILAGDSAGGGLALAALLALRDAGNPLPAGAVCISPWTDLSLSGASIQAKAGADAILTQDILRQFAEYYIADHPPTTPLISPLFADLKGLPPLLIQVGTEEILLDDAVKFAEKAQAAGVKTELEIYEGLFHVFHIFFFLPETKIAVARIAKFIARTIHQ